MFRSLIAAVFRPLGILSSPALVADEAAVSQMRVRGIAGQSHCHLGRH